MANLMTLRHAAAKAARYAKVAIGDCESARRYDLPLTAAAAAMRAWEHYAIMAKLNRHIAALELHATESAMRAAINGGK